MTMERWEYCFVPKIASGAHGTRDATLAVEINKMAALGWRAVHIRDSGAYMERRLTRQRNAENIAPPSMDVRDNTG